MKKDKIKVTIKRRLVEAIQSTPKAVGPPLFNRIQFEIPPLDPLSWLKSQTAPIKTYGSERRRHYEVAGIGAVDILTDDGVSDFSNVFPEI